MYFHWITESFNTWLLHRLLQRKFVCRLCRSFSGVLAGRRVVNTRLCWLFNVLHSCDILATNGIIPAQTPRNEHENKLAIPMLRVKCHVHMGNLTTLEQFSCPKLHVQNWMVECNRGGELWMSISCAWPANRNGRVGLSGLISAREFTMVELNNNNEF